MSEEVADFVHCPRCGVYTVGPCQCDAVHADDAPKSKKKTKKVDPAPDAPAVDPAPEAPAPDAPTE